MMNQPTLTVGSNASQIAAASLAAVQPRRSLDPPVLLPILVGITGKRELTADQAVSVRQRLDEVFRRLDSDFPLVPKVLLTGGAYGADAIAAEMLTRVDQDSLARFPNWSVVVLLPFDQILFEKDFRPKIEADQEAAAQASERLTRLRELLSGSERVLVRVLPPLRMQTGLAQPEDLDKDIPNADKILRREHYEQVGQCIAEAATVLIAVMDGSEAANRKLREGEPATTSGEADGRTARIVAYRRAGRPDAPGTAVAKRSAVLRHDWGALVDPPAGFVWLIEPCGKARVGNYPVTVLPPLTHTSVEDVYARVALAEPLVKAPWWLGWYGRWQRRTEARHNLRASLVMLGAFDRLHRPGELAQQRPPLDLTRLARPTDAIVTIRRVISQLQGNAKSRADRAFLTIAALFVLAVLSLEVFAKFHPQSAIALGCYLVALGGIFSVVLLSRAKQWQPLSEDYRSVNEMLRVQWAWWSAGMSDRVDHRHLQSVDPELARIRQAVQTILAWIWLRSNWTSARPDKPDWADVRGRMAVPRRTESFREDKNTAKDWIGSQIQYFARRHHKYHRRVRWLGTALWSLFAASGWLAGLLCLWLAEHESRDYFLHLGAATQWLPPGRGAAASISAVWTGLAVGLVGLWSWIASQPVLEKLAHRSWRTTWTVFTAVVGFAVALLLAVAVQGGAMWLAGSVDAHATAHDAEHLAVVVFVTLSALAGAMRYVSEKLNFEAQALEYRDILERFERAERLLAEGSNSQTPAPARTDMAQGIVRDLALLALRENEAWLKARRERPLSPVVG